VRKQVLDEEGDLADALFEAQVAEVNEMIDQWWYGEARTLSWDDAFCDGKSTVLSRPLIGTHTQ
jgi:hypothetical protein